MQRLRLLILLTVCFLMASAAWADDLGYVDCNNHPDATPVFPKARQTPDTLGAVACGERFTVLVYGFVFSRVQTKDGKVGFVYSNLITVDHGGAQPPAPAVRVPTSAPAAAPANSQRDYPPPVETSLPPKRAPAQAAPLFPTPPQSVAPPVDAAPAPSQASASVAIAPAAAPAAPAAPPQPQPPASQPAATQPAPAPVTPAPAPPAPAPAASAQPATPPPSQPSAPSPAPAPPVETHPAAQPAPSQLASTQVFPTPPPPAPASSASDAAPAPAPVPDPPPAAASQPQPEAAQPAPAPVREASVRSSWERPLPGARQNFLVELFSGFAFARFTSAGTSTNLNGGMGSFGYNLKPWLQIVGDSSYNFVTVSGTKNVLWGNHYGGRFYYRRAQGRWGMTPFVEALVGGSRLDSTTAGVKTSTNCISYKAGGGIDVRVKRHWEIRLINVDYYRTTFGAGGYTAAQNNYWASAGVILRLFGSAASE